MTQGNRRKHQNLELRSGRTQGRRVYQTFSFYLRWVEGQERVETVTVGLQTKRTRSGVIRGRNQIRRIESHKSDRWSCQGFICSLLYDWTWKRSTTNKTNLLPPGFLVKVWILHCSHNLTRFWVRSNKLYTTTVVHLLGINYECVNKSTADIG